VIFTTPRAELAVHVFVGDDGNEAVGKRQAHVAADEVPVAVVVGMHGHGGVAEHRLGARGRDHEEAAAVRERIAQVPEAAVLLLRLHLEVGHAVCSTGSQWMRRLPR
jgi:hypothetical protein